ncbi:MULTISPECIES: RHS repeat-associated core domain-containing protein [unclassified Pseudomonas]|uniref:RHS repeat-associated core domain-containing protein n=1 Tax=unclassified Pseudomonas TaxID=196821 RepID=UPI0018E693EF|nr:RHS repeat-associated core domain-containing protein [Pseudomonas sp. CCOS 191]MBI6952280.1 RHS repeat-associated core domain-containing protein [Pseudomonas sp. CCOS 191]
MDKSNRGRSEAPGILAVDRQATVLRRSHVSQPSTFTYCPYGYLPERNDSTLLRFNGQPLELPIPLYLLGNGYRAFNSVLMRFHSADSKSPFGDGGINAYTYCAGDPVNNTDPSGHIVEKVLNAFAGRVVFEGPYQVLFKGNDQIAPTVFHKEVLGSGMAGFVTHSTPSGSRLTNEFGHLRAAEKVARKEIAPRLMGIKAYRKDPNKPLVLLACYAGSTGAAQIVADTLHRPVIAYMRKLKAPKAPLINRLSEDGKPMPLHEYDPEDNDKLTTAVPQMFYPLAQVRSAS